MQQLPAGRLPFSRGGGYRKLPSRPLEPSRGQVGERLSPGNLAQNRVHFRVTSTILPGKANPLTLALDPALFLKDFSSHPPLHQFQPPHGSFQLACKCSLYLCLFSFTARLLKKRVVLTHCIHFLTFKISRSESQLCHLLWAALWGVISLSVPQFPPL